MPFKSTPQNDENTAKNITEINTSEMRVIKRNGDVDNFHHEKIDRALLSAFLEEEGSDVGNSMSTRNKVAEMRDDVIRVLWLRKISGGTMATHIEEIQDVVEETLMRFGEHKVARAYVLYREARNIDRKENLKSQINNISSEINIYDDSGVKIPLPIKDISELVISACTGLKDVDAKKIIETAKRDLYEGASMKEVRAAIIMSSRSFLEQDPSYSKVTARLLLNDIRLEVMGRSVTQKEMTRLYSSSFQDYIYQGISGELLDPKMATFNLNLLGSAIDASRDLQFSYLGLQTLYDRYFLHINEKRIEMPQSFYMRVAMGIALNEKPQERDARAIEFYNILSTFDFMSSTPTLFNSGTLHSQLSSCYLSTVADDLGAIFEQIKENALLSKYAGGLGNDWTPVRGLGAHIKGTNGKSQGVVPFLKVVNDTAVAVNQGGKRKGAVCAYLETWHLDMEEFLDLRKNTGDDRRRTADMNTANWIPDLFMKRVISDSTWTLFSPSSCEDLHELTGKAFEKRYVDMELSADRGEIMPFRRINAKDLWRKMLGMLFETGHPWITFKDPCNIRSPQQHVGVVHSSNLCTEITLNTSTTETAVCNLGSVNLVNHMSDNGKLNHEKLQRTIKTAMRMLDNVIDINFYPIEKAKVSNLRHRPVGLGVMGYQDCLHKMRVPFASNEAIEFADRSMEAVCYYAYSASAELAIERGAYESFKGSLWSKGILPYDTISMLKEERQGFVEVDMSITMDWDSLREKIKRSGMRNSNCVAIAPTATISNIIDVSPCIEPTYQNLYVKSNLSGEFTVINEYLVNDLKNLGLWNKIMIADLKYFDGALEKISNIPEDVKKLYQTAFEMDPTWLIEAASRRQKWIDQSQSLNIYMGAASGKKMDETYKLAWLRGLKTTYYLRSMGATRAEKSTGNGGELNSVKSTPN
jgi:ribonucleoside-diphosphate reductase alpha chain